MAVNLVQIEKYLNSLNYNWYQSKLYFFKQEEDYDISQDLIILTFNEREEVFEEEDENYHFETICDSKEITFLQYCFNSDFRGSLYQNNETADEHGTTDIYNLPIDVNPINDNILNYAKHQLKNIFEVKYQYKILSKILGIINGILSSNDNNKDDKYLKLRENIKTILIQSLRENYGNIISAYKTYHTEMKAPKTLSEEVCDKIADIKINHLKIYFKS